MRLGPVVAPLVLRVGHQRPVADLHRIGPAGDLDDRRRGARGRREVPGEPLGVDRRRGDDDLQVRPRGQQAAQVAEDEVDVEAALVRLVDDQRVRSRWISASRMPSVISLTSVFSPTRSVKRTV